MKHLFLLPPFLFAALSATAQPEDPAVKAKQDRARAEMAEIGKALDLYYQDCNSYPSHEDGGLEALRIKPASCENWGPEPYIKHLRPDPWGRDYIYERPDPTRYELRSYGLDGREGGIAEDADITTNQN